MVYTKREAVDKYGNENQKAHFEKHGKFKSKHVENAVIKTMEEIYEFVEIIKNPHGSGNVYRVGVEKEERSVREDGRISNGAWKPYTKNLDIIVVSVLEQGLEKEDSQTLAGWALDFGVINVKTYEILRSRWRERDRDNFIKELKKGNIIQSGEDRLVDDYTLIVKGLIKQIAGTLNRMKGLGIIEYYPVHKGKLLNGEEINLSVRTHKEATSLKRTLMEKHDVTDWYISTYRKTKKTKAYEKEFDEKIATITDDNGIVLGLSYCFEEYAIYLKARKKKIIAYLKKYNKEAIEQFKLDETQFLIQNKEDFQMKRLECVVEEAEKKVHAFLKPRLVKETDEELGGKSTYNTPKLADYCVDEDYYKLYFDRLYIERIEGLQKYYGYDFS
ncbi:hypothetical protein [Bacillus massiliigorillae]|uniref:hypothetical protein n=1 Tax=Bacillus massiliigorillae TaxID=1243664 RepID=UPI0003A7374D|nr:hypothetical protein [Bacillus massiliigorillae]